MMMMMQVVYLPDGQVSTEPFRVYKPPKHAMVLHGEEHGYFTKLGL